MNIISSVFTIESYSFVIDLILTSQPALNNSLTTVYGLPLIKNKYRKEHSWALAPLFVPQRHWCKLKQVTHGAVRQILKKWHNGSGANINGVNSRPCCPI